MPDNEAARRAAITVLPDMACDKLPNGDRRKFAVSVRDEAGASVYSVNFDLVGKWHA